MISDKDTLQDRNLKKVLPAGKQWPQVVAILMLAVIVAFFLNFFKPEAEKKAVKDEFPLAEFVVARSELIAIPVVSQGSIKAKTYIKLVAEVNGRISQIAKLRFNGGFFKKGELLLSIDDTDYRLAMVRADAQVTAAKQQLIRVETEAGQARYDLKQIGRDPSKSTSYALREPQLAEAQANLQAAQAELEIARLQMQRTRVLAPFDGRVMSKQVDIGQYVTSGTLLADIYSTQTVTVRLPLSLYQTELLGIQLTNNQQLLNSMKIKLIAESSSGNYQWQASMSHTEGEMDERNRLVYLVAEVDSPFAMQQITEKNITQNFPKKPPLTPGMFVKAELSGVKKQIIKLPRSVLRYGKNVWLINQQDQLQKQKIEILSKDRHYIYIKSGVNQGDRVIVNSIDFPVQGMQLSPLRANASTQTEAMSFNE